MTETRAAMPEEYNALIRIAQLEALIAQQERHIETLEKRLAMITRVSSR